MTTPDEEAEAIADRLTALAERVEALTGPNRIVAREVLFECGKGYVSPFYRWLDPTASLDDAMALVPEGMGLSLTRYWLSSRTDPAWMCEIVSGGTPDNPSQVYAADDCHSAALALTAAALRARAAQSRTRSNGEQ